MVSYEISFLCGALSMFVGAGSVILSEQVHPGCIQRQREPCVKALGCITKSLRWPLGRIMQIFWWLVVSHFVALGFACGIACLPATLFLLGCVRNTLALIENVRRKRTGSSTGEAGRVKQEKGQTTTRKERRQATLQQHKVDDRIHFRDVRARRVWRSLLTAIQFKPGCLVMWMCHAFADLVVKKS